MRRILYRDGHLDLVINDDVWRVKREVVWTFRAVRRGGTLGASGRPWCGRCGGLRKQRFARGYMDATMFSDGDTVAAGNGDDGWFLPEGVFPERVQELVARWVEAKEDLAGIAVAREKAAAKEA